MSDGIWDSEHPKQYGGEHGHQCPRCGAKQSMPVVKGKKIDFYMCMSCGQRFCYEKQDDVTE